MNPKIEITRYVAEQLGLATDDKSIKKLVQVFWQNIRLKEKGGLWLTDKGFECLVNASIKYHRVEFDESIHVDNSLILWIDRNIDCPFYITHKEIYLFGERMAVQLVLFAGNLQKLQRANKRFTEKQKIT
jgi:hypothetical protein